MSGSTAEDREVAVVGNYLVMTYDNEANWAEAGAPVAEANHLRHQEFAQANGAALRGATSINSRPSAINWRPPHGSPRTWISPRTASRTPTPRPSCTGRHITRAKLKIAKTRIPYRVPGVGELPERIDAVLDVVHLVYSVGSTAKFGDQLSRPDLARRGLDLARMVPLLLPDSAEASALLGPSDRPAGPRSPASPFVQVRIFLT